jgi:nitrogenase molybdenum-cofactor synthesis protein NifE
MIEDGNPRNLLDLYRQEGADIMVAGGRNQYTALKARIPFLDINQEREYGYAGYDGMLELARQLCLTIESPIWPAVRSAPPWRTAAEADSDTARATAGERPAQPRRTAATTQTAPARVSATESEATHA